MVAIERSRIPMWLAGIDPRKIREDLREKLALYQNECAEVLARHFLGQHPNTMSMTAEQFQNLLREATTLLTGRVEHLQQQLDRLLALPPASGAPTPQLPRFTVQQRLEWKGWVEASREARRKIRRLAVARIDANFGDTPDQAGGPGGGGPLRFYGAQ
jgi:hypothetical protein